VNVKEHADWESFWEAEKPEHIYFYSKLATRSYLECEYPSPVYLVFGSETKGLPETFHRAYAERFLQIPMRTHLVRSLNLAQAAAVALYESMRQNHYAPVDPD
jgi:tRNA (cytidine/uridine-2'-O-)-methyltransferase